MYTKIYLHEAYNLVHIQKNDEWKMVLRTHYGHFEYVVMTFDFTNALVIFQHLMNDVFREYLDDFMVCYIDDILIFSKNMEDHERHVHLVWKMLREVRLYTTLEKCEFHQFKHYNKRCPYTSNVFTGFWVNSLVVVNGDQWRSNEFTGLVNED